MILVEENCFSVAHTNFISVTVHTTIYKNNLKSCPSLAYMDSEFAQSCVKSNAPLAHASIKVMNFPSVGQYLMTSH